MRPRRPGAGSYRGSLRVSRGRPPRGAGARRRTPPRRPPAGSPSPGRAWRRSTRASPRGEAEAGREHAEVGSGVHEGRRVGQEAQRSQHGGEALGRRRGGTGTEHVLGGGHAARHPVHHLPGGLHHPLALIAPQVALSKHRRRVDAELQLVPHPEHPLGLPHLRPATPIQDIGAGDVDHAHVSQRRLDDVLDLLHAGRAAARAPRERGDHALRRLLGQPRVSTAHLACRAAHRLDDARPVEGNEAAVPGADTPNGPTIHVHAPDTGTA